VWWVGWKLGWKERAHMIFFIRNRLLKSKNMLYSSMLSRAVLPCLKKHVWILKQYIFRSEISRKMNQLRGLSSLGYWHAVWDMGVYFGLLRTCQNIAVLMICLPWKYCYSKPKQHIVMSIQWIQLEINFCF
jgi:hypothetical protein